MRTSVTSPAKKLINEMMASTIERPFVKTHFNGTVKPGQPQKEATPFFTFTAEDLYNCLHQNAGGKVEPVNLEESRFKKLKDSFTGAEMHPSFCRKCHKVYAICCPIHSTHISPKDFDADNSVDWDGYAIKSFPDVVQLCKSSIPGKKYGVSARQHIPEGTWIGPYEGRRVAPDAINPNMDSSYLWEIYKDGKLLYYLDATDEESSSWMRFIKCARHINEQNLFAFQYCGNIYYRAFKDIPVGTELLVWYEEVYPQYFGIPLSIHDMNSTGSRPYPLTATPYTEGHKVALVPTPTFVTTTQSSTHAQAPNQRKSPHYKPLSAQSRARQSFAEAPQKENTNKPMQKDNVKRKHEENDCHSKKLKSQHLPQKKTDGSKEMLQKLEDARLKDKAELPCEWPRVADGEFILESGEPKIWHCGQCNKSFAQRSSLQIHSCSRNTNRPYQCGHCTQEFAHPNELRTHAVIHSGKKPFKCGFCARTFAGATTLNNHVRTHTGERPFSCNKCFKTFSQASQLSKHKRSLYDCYA